MKILFLINDAPYGTEKFYNACRLAMTIQKDLTEVEVNDFLMADSVTGALVNQNPPQGYYNIERMLKSVVLKKGQIKICTSCVEARGLKEMKFVEGASLSSMKELTQLTMESDKVLTF